ncbi:macrophage mannose receptor 1-like [Diabrotica virgifera virgifera]|uniref:C-type lectin domain-containing protein n=1 Tax=Diabrotica virgifera virgifera TaxID=50390 RepID=A0ABM5KVF5_DIAVI|nr:macrophage mannose receptor 1-like [Diabrotica virgifera virgifera]
MYRWCVRSLLFIFPLVLGDAPSVFEPEGVVPFIKFGSKNYYFSYRFKANFFQADQICKDINMILVAIPSKEVNDFLNTTISAANSKINFWTSGSNLVDKMSWMWMSNAQPITYSNWNHGQPSASANRCLLGQMVKGKDLLWMNEDCNALYNFVCESIEPAASSQTVGGGNWANSFADPAVSPNFPLFQYNNKNYYVNTQPLSFLDADRFCRMINMELVAVDSDAENTGLYTWLRNINMGTNFWTGGTNLINGIDWIWFPSGRKVTFTNWMKGQPDNIIERCIQLVVNKDMEQLSETIWWNGGMEWSNLGCEVTLPFICQSPTEKITRRPAAVAANENSKSLGVTETSDVISPPGISNQIVTTSESLTADWISNMDASETYDETSDVISTPDTSTQIETSPATITADWNSSMDESETYDETSDVISTPDISTQIVTSPETIIINGNSVEDTRDVISCPKIFYRILYNIKVSYDDAVKKCKKRGMSLVSIQSKEKSNSLNTVLQASSYGRNTFWTSGNKKYNKWTWLKGEPLEFTNWNAGEPNNGRGNEDCLTVTVFKSDNHSLWNDEPCGWGYTPVCEKVVECSE